MGPDIVFPAAAYLAMAVEAIFQTSQSLNVLQGESQNKRTRYRLRDVMFIKALVLQDGDVEHKIMLTLTPHQGTKALWHEFKISSLSDDIWTEHCHGLISLEEHTEEGKRFLIRSIWTSKLTKSSRSGSCSQAFGTYNVSSLMV